MNSITKDILSYNLQDIPFSLIDDLEFYGEGEECVTTDEVKYFLPCKLEYIFLQWVKLDLYDYCIHSLDHGFFKYKLSQIKSWTIEEQNSVFNFLFKIWEFLLTYCADINNYIDLCETIPLDKNKLTSLWYKVTHDRKEKQLHNFFE